MLCLLMSILLGLKNPIVGVTYFVVTTLIYHKLAKRGGDPLDYGVYELIAFFLGLVIVIPTFIILRYLGIV